MPFSLSRLPRGRGPAGLLRDCAGECRLLGSHLEEIILPCLLVFLAAIEPQGRIGRVVDDVVLKMKARAAFIKEFRDSFGSPYAAAASGHVDDVILPSETRPKLVAGLDYLREKQASLPPKKHGCMPV